jgi:hypothetical protein
MRCWIVLACALAATSCGNPAVDARIEALGEENPNVEPSQYHRPGQPCVLCHSEYEGEEPLMSVGGTIFGTSGERVPVEGVIVKMWDSSGSYFEAVTNCIGNFYVEKEKWDPNFPLHVEMEYPVPGAVDPETGQTETRVISMGTRISRDGSCAGCHVDNKLDMSATQGSPGRVYCVDQATADADAIVFKPPSASCPGKL